MTDSPFAEWCWNLRVSVAIRGAPWPFPALEILHIVGLILVFGTVLILDLRLLGVLLRREPAWQISADLTRWAWPGFALQLLTGPLLFVANSRKFCDSRFFRCNLVLLVLAVAFHFTVVRRVSASIDAGVARWAGGVSLALWAAVILSGVSIELF